MDSRSGASVKGIEVLRSTVRWQVSRHGVVRWYKMRDAYFKVPWLDRRHFHEKAGRSATNKAKTSGFNQGHRFTYYVTTMLSGRELFQSKTVRSCYIIIICDRTTTIDLGVFLYRVATERLTTLTKQQVGISILT